MPLPAALNEDFIASNLSDRSNNVLTGTNSEVISKLRQDIRDMKEKTEKVMLLWTANTEMFYLSVIETIIDLKRAIAENHKLPSSILYCVAAIEEQVLYLNGSP